MIDKPLAFLLNSERLLVVDDEKTAALVAIVHFDILLLLFEVDVFQEKLISVFIGWCSLRQSCRFAGDRLGAECSLGKLSNSICEGIRLGFTLVNVFCMGRLWLIVAPIHGQSFLGLDTESTC